MSLVAVSQRDRLVVWQWIRLVMVLLLVLEFTLFATIVPHRPSADDRFEKSLPGGPWANVIGQSGYWPVICGILVVLAIYAAKTTIICLCERIGLAITTFATILMACVPVFWVFVTTDWNNPHAELAYWLTTPVGLLTIPTIGMVIDLQLRPYRKIGQYVFKTAIEFILIPLWFYAWVLIEFVLGFYWI